MQSWVAGLSSDKWGQKRAAAKAVAELAGAGGDALPPHTSALLSALLQASTHPPLLKRLLLISPLCFLTAPFNNHDRQASMHIW